MRIWDWDVSDETAHVFQKRKLHAAWNAAENWARNLVSERYKDRWSRPLGHLGVDYALKVIVINSCTEVSNEVQRLLTTMFYNCSKYIAYFIIHFSHKIIFLHIRTFPQHPVHLL